MFCIFSMFSAFSLFFMVSHPGWQDGTICGALLDIKRDIHAETSGKIIFKISKRIFTQSLCGKEYSWCSSSPQTLPPEEDLVGQKADQKSCYRDVPDIRRQSTVWYVGQWSILRITQMPENLSDNYDFMAFFNRVLAIIHDCLSVNMLLLQVIAHGWSMKNAIGNVLVY